jgi:hypothetical protein
MHFHAGPSVADLPAADRAAAAWCAEVNAAVQSEICAVPAERLEAERALLGPLPSLRPEIGSRPVSRKVDKLSYLQFGSARYSVPSQLIGTTVLIAVSGTTIRILEPFTGQIAAERQLVPPEDTSITEEHYGSARPDKPQRAPRPKTAAEKQFLGPRRARGGVLGRRGRPACPAWPGKSARSSPCEPRTVMLPWSPRWNGPCSSAGGGRMTCARKRRMTDKPNYRHL